MALKKISALTGHEGRVWNVAWRPREDCFQFASCGEDRKILLWGLRRDADAAKEGSWHLLCDFEASEQHARTIRSLAWSPAGDLLAATSFDATTSLWREEDSPALSPGGATWVSVAEVTGHENEVKSAAFSPSGQYFATCSRDKSVWIYETDARFAYECAAILQSHTQDVKMVRWHPAQDVLFSCSYDDTVKIWGQDGDDWDCKETLHGHDSTVWAIAFNATGSRFVTCSEDTTMRVWAPKRSVMSRVSTAVMMTPLFRGTTAALDGPSAAPEDAACGWQCVAVVQGMHPRPVYAVAWCPFPIDVSHSSFVATACGDNRLRVLKPGNEASLEGWTCAADTVAHDGDVNCVAWCPTRAVDGTVLLASGGDDEEVVIWSFVCDEPL